MATYFLSDLHLGARYLGDQHEAQRRVNRFLDSIRGDAESLYLVGDVLDYWFEYRHVVPRGYVRFLGKLAELADAGVKITWLIGNHDIWLFDYLRDELGIEVVDGVLHRKIEGHEFMITHGDGVGKLPLYFRTMRAMFRNRVLQRLYAGVHPRWTVPLAFAWSSSSREGHQRKAPYENQRGIGRLRDFTVDYSRKHPEVEYFVYGHLHEMVDEKLPDGARMIVLGDWIEHFSYGVFRDGRFSLHRFAE